ncbi:hypothetical protein ANTRET_LOCUS1012 [Anthophora retusa]
MFTLGYTGERDRGFVILCSEKKESDRLTDRQTDRERERERERKSAQRARECRASERAEREKCRAEVSYWLITWISFLIQSN